MPSVTRSQSAAKGKCSAGDQSLRRQSSPVEPQPRVAERLPPEGGLGIGGPGSETPKQEAGSSFFLAGSVLDSPEDAPPGVRTLYERVTPEAPGTSATALGAGGATNSLAVSVLAKSAGNMATLTETKVVDASVPVGSSTGAPHATAAAMTAPPAVTASTALPAPAGASLPAHRTVLGVITPAVINVPTMPAASTSAPGPATAGPSGAATTSLPGPAPAGAPVAATSSHMGAAPAVHPSVPITHAGAPPVPPQTAAAGVGTTHFPSAHTAFGGAAGLLYPPGGSGGGGPPLHHGTGGTGPAPLPGGTRAGGSSSGAGMGGGGGPPAGGPPGGGPPDGGPPGGGPPYGGPPGGGHPVGGPLGGGVGLPVGLPTAPGQAQMRAPSPYNGLVDGIPAEKVLGQSIHKLKMDTKFQGRLSGVSWYDWSYQFQLKMTIVHLWAFFEGLLHPPVSGDPKHEAEYHQLSLMAFAVLNTSVSDHIQQAIRAFRDTTEPARKAWKYMLDTFQTQDSTSRILLADQLTRFKQRPNEDLEVYINRLRALRTQMDGVKTPIAEESFCVYLVKGLSPEWEYLKQYFTLQPAMTEESVVHAMTTAQRSKNADLQRRGQKLVSFVPNQALPALAGPSNRKSYDDRGKTRFPRKSDSSPGRDSRPLGARGSRNLANIICFNCKQSGHGWQRCSTLRPGYQPSESDRQAVTALRRQQLQRKGHGSPFVSSNQSGGHNRAMVAQVHQCHVSPVGRKERGVWLLDSGCSIHMTFDRTAFRKLRPIYKGTSILVGNNQFIQATGQGEVPLDTPQGPIVLTNVLLVPELSSNLISYTRLLQRGCTIISTSTGVNVIEEEGHLLLTAEEKGGMLCVRATQKSHRNRRVATESRKHRAAYPGPRPCPYNNTDNRDVEVALNAVQSGVSDPISRASLQTWHTRLGHVNKDYIKRTADVADGMKITGDEGEPKAADCVDCVLFKIRQQHFPPIPESKRKSQKPLDLVHSDIAYALPETAYGEKYILVLVDDYTRFEWAYPLSNRTAEEVFPILQAWLNRVENQCDRKLKVLRADHAKEYTSNEAKDWADARGFKLEYSAPKASQQNGVAERAIGVLRAGCMATLERSKLSQHFWPYALAHHVWASNRTVHTSNLEHTPYELWEGHVPSLAPAKTFGCMALYYVPRESRLKHEPRARWGVYLGIAEDCKAWLFAELPLMTRPKIVHSTSASFFEHMTYEDYKGLAKSKEEMLAKLFDEAQEVAQAADTLTGEMPTPLVDAALVNDDDDNDDIDNPGSGADWSFPDAIPDSPTEDSADDLDVGVQTRAQRAAARRVAAPIATAAQQSAVVRPEPADNADVPAQEAEGDNDEDLPQPVLEGLAKESLLALQEGQGAHDSDDAVPAPKTPERPEKGLPVYDDISTEGTRMTESLKRSKSFSKLLGPEYRPLKDLPKPVGPVRVGKQGKKKILSVLGITKTKPTPRSRKGSAAAAAVGAIPETDTSTNGAQSEQALMLLSDLDVSSRTQQAKGQYESLQSGDPSIELSPEEKLAQDLVPERQRSRLDLSYHGQGSIDEDGSYDDTASSKEPEDEDEDAPLDYDTNGEPETHHYRHTQPVCIVSASTKDNDVVANFCCNQLQALVAREQRKALPPEPKNLHEALTGPHRAEWEKAIQAEYDALIERNTWELVELPPGRRAIGVKWVLKIKTNAQGDLEKFKARLVAKGYAQVKGVDYDDTYAPVSRFTTFRALMALTAHEGYHVSQLDVKNAFLYGDLDQTEIYMQQPEGKSDGTGRACKLVKSLYGLKQAPLVWYYHIEHHLLENGWTVCDSDWALFTLTRDGETCWLLLYVDDILVFSKSARLIKIAEDMLICKYNMQKENLSKYLGINISLQPGRVELGLQKYIRKLGDKFTNVPNRKTQVPLSIDPNTDSLSEEPTKQDTHLYQSMVGSIMFAASTVRVDIQHACSKLAQGNKKPSLLHREQVGKAMRYLFDTAEVQLVYTKEPGQETVKLSGFVDANFKLDGKAQTGYVFLLSGAAISWGSKKQTAPVTSSSEAELVAAVSAAQEAVYLRRLMKELGHEQKAPTPLFTDNSAIITLSETEKRLGNSKHFHRLSWLRHMVKRREVVLVPVRSADQTADYLTKTLTVDRFQECRRMCGLLESSPATLSAV